MPLIIKEPEPRKHYCCSCGKSYTKQKGNFPTTQSPMFKGNNGFAPMCKTCTDQWYYYLVKTLGGNEERAMDRMAAMFDWYYSDVIMASTRKISADRSRVNAYPSKQNLPQYNKHEDGSPVTYLDTIKDRNSGFLLTNTSDNEQGSESKTPSKASVLRWGAGVFKDASSYNILDEHYNMLKKQNPNCDNNQEIFIKDLCYLHVQKLKAMDDPDTFNKAVKAYRETFTQAGLKTAPDAEAGIDEPFGVVVSYMSQHTPEEYYKDKKLYKDFDGLGEYISRFITRPLRNLQFNQHERDPEYQVKDETDED